jgi:transcriptional regulator GlxA family with amidase domain
MSARPIIVSILATAETSAVTLLGLTDVLRGAGVLWEQCAGLTPREQCKVRIVAAQAKPLHLRGAMVIPDCTIAEADDAASDIVVVASLNIPLTDKLQGHDTAEFEWLVRERDRGTCIASACTGAAILAEAGLLDGREATSHWASRDMFRKHYPKVRLRLEKDLCVAGERGQIVTSGGATDWQQMALYLIARFCGLEHAAHTADFWLIPLREEGQASHAWLSELIPHCDGIVGVCQAWIADNYTDANPVTSMIKRSGLTPTTFARRFRRATGYRPIDYVHAIRIQKAKDLLVTSRHAVDEVGREVGYEDPASFRRIFKRSTGLAPSGYRRRFSRFRFEQLVQS